MIVLCHAQLPPENMVIEVGHPDHNTTVKFWLSTEGVTDQNKRYAQIQNVLFTSLEFANSEAMFERKTAK